MNPSPPAAPASPAAASATPPDRARWRQRQLHEPCRNCGDPAVGNYCPSCGQRKVEVRVSVRRMLLEVLDDQLSVNSALPRTLARLLFSPGHLTREYVDCRIARYIAPFRLYLASSVLFFLLLSFAQQDWITLGHAPTSMSPAAAAASPAPSVGAVAAPSAAAAADVRQRAGDRAIGFVLRGDTLRGQATGPLEFVTIQLTWPWLERLVRPKLEELAGSRLRELLPRLLDSFLEHVPQAMFLLLPVFALLLKLLYLRQKRFYVEHFVFALHGHAFMFLVFTLLLLLPQGVPYVGPLLLLWMGAYFFLAMKRVYRQGWWMTGLKYLTLSWSYFFALVFGLIATALVWVLLI